MSTGPVSLSSARRIVAVGAVALLVFMFFFSWYGGNVTGLAHGARLTGATLSSTGWQTFTVSRWIWLLTALVAFGSVIALAGGYKDDGVVPLSALVAGLGVLATALIVIRIVHHPGPSANAGSLHISYGIKAGIWLGLVATLAIAFGGYVQTRPQKPQTAADATSEDPAAAFSGLTLGDAPPASSSSSASASGSTAAPASGLSAASAGSPETDSAASPRPAAEPTPPSA
jgi:hypothetical protein